MTSMDTFLAAKLGGVFFLRLGDRRWWGRPQHRLVCGACAAGLAGMATIVLLIDYRTAGLCVGKRRGNTRLPQRLCAGAPNTVVFIVVEAFIWLEKRWTRCRRCWVSNTLDAPSRDLGAPPADYGIVAVWEDISGRRVWGPACRCVRLYNAVA